MIAIRSPRRIPDDPGAKLEVPFNWCVLGLQQVVDSSLITRLPKTTKSGFRNQHPVLIRALPGNMPEDLIVQARLGFIKTYSRGVIKIQPRKRNMLNLHKGASSASLNSKAVVLDDSPIPRFMSTQGMTVSSSGRSRSTRGRVDGTAFDRDQSSLGERGRAHLPAACLRKRARGSRSRVDQIRRPKRRIILPGWTQSREMTFQAHLSECSKRHLWLGCLQSKKQKQKQKQTSRAMEEIAQTTGRNHGTWQFTASYDKKGDMPRRQNLFVNPGRNQLRTGAGGEKNISVKICARLPNLASYLFESANHRVLYDVAQEGTHNLAACGPASEAQNNVTMAMRKCASTARDPILQTYEAVGLLRQVETRREQVLLTDLWKQADVTDNDKCGGQRPDLELSVEPWPMDEEDLSLVSPSQFPQEEHSIQ
ncbi:hypothetical protein BJ875DRAFT_442608 [Amylocarpus encephaloides]|uniref:Uncharacterized protein n=1 Tax=Amylocarpus encephaloides TaxID=45428 RepID=A0A9P8C418_9HELO|nr:hypothetical protein BJ875DRAFT_442608 [Amylocarpus encephaloides]